MATIVSYNKNSKWDGLRRKIGIQWVNTDNTIVMVTLDELKEALALAGQEMSRIWLEQ